MVTIERPGLRPISIPADALLAVPERPVNMPDSPLWMTAELRLASGMEIPGAVRIQPPSKIWGESPRARATGVLGVIQARTVNLLNAIERGRYGLTAGTTLPLSYRLLGQCPWDIPGIQADGWSRPLRAADMAQSLIPLSPI